MSAGEHASRPSGVDEDLVDAFVQLWDSGKQPDLGNFLDTADAVSSATLLELARVDLDARWQANRRVPAEYYLRQFAALQTDSERALDLIFSEILLREKLGETLGAVEYCNRFPEFTDALHRQFAVHDAIGADAPPIQVGSPAPEFSLPSTKRLETLGEPVTLAEYRGKWLVLFFYPRDFSMVCPTEVMAFSRRIGEFRRMNADILGVSTDPIESHAEWITRPVEQSGLGGLTFPLASDVDGEVSARYGVLLREQVVALRGLFIIDPGGVLQYQVVHNLAVGRRCNIVLELLHALQTGGACGEDWEVGDETLDPGQVIKPGTIVGAYQVRELLGEGSSSVVYRAVDTKLRRPVALKVLRHQDPTWTQRLLAEARATAALHHPSLCVVYEVDDRQGMPYIAMQYVEGKTLQEIVTEGALAPEDAVAIASQIADGLAVAHAAHLVHGDLKPHNLIVSDNQRVTLVDFGLAKHFAVDPHGPTLTEAMAAVVTGTPAYMSPEQVRGDPLDPRSDIFSLGILLYQMLTRTLPFAGRTAFEVTSSILSEGVVVPGSVPRGLARVLKRALSKHPEERQLCMPVLKEELAACLKE